METFRDESVTIDDDSDSISCNISDLDRACNNICLLPRIHQEFKNTCCNCTLYVDACPEQANVENCVRWEGLGDCETRKDFMFRCCNSTCGTATMEELLLTEEQIGVAMAAIIILLVLVILIVYILHGRKKNRPRSLRYEETYVRGSDLYSP